MEFSINTKYSLSEFLLSIKFQQYYKSGVQHLSAWIL